MLRKSFGISALWWKEIPDLSWISENSREEHPADTARVGTSSLRHSIRSRDQRRRIGARDDCSMNARLTRANSSNTSSELSRVRLRNVVAMIRLSNPQIKT